MSPAARGSKWQIWGLTAAGTGTTHPGSNGPVRVRGPPGQSRAPRVSPLPGKPHCQPSLPARVPGARPWPTQPGQAESPAPMLGNCPKRFQGGGLRDETLYE